MGKREKKFAALFRNDWTDEMLACEMLAGLSINTEVMVKVQVIPSKFKPGYSKVTVQKVIAALGAEGTYKAWPLGTDPNTDDPVEVWGKRLFEDAAGSSANIASVLGQLQRDLPAPQQQRVGIIATVGQGHQAHALVSKLADRGFQYALMPADGTNATLNLKGGDQQVMLCEKRTYVPQPGLVDFLRQADPKVSVFTGVRPQDLQTVQDIFWAFRNKRTFRVLGPHLDLLFQASFRSRIRKIISGLELLALSEDEALTLVSDLNLFGGDKSPFNPTDESHVKMLLAAVAGFGAKITSVTFAEHGVAVLASGQLIRHSGFRPPKGVRDTAGAGDTFLAALLYFYVLTNRRVNSGSVNLKALERAVELAQYVAACKVSHYGSSSGIPPQHEVVRRREK